MINSLITSFVTVFVIQSVFAAFAISFKSDKLTDLSYGLTFVILAASLIFMNSSPNSFQFLIFAMVFFWGLRLAIYLFMRILKTKKDKRFDNIRNSSLKFAQFWFFQAISIWIISLTFIFSLSSKIEVNNLLVTLAGLIVSICGLLIETVADWQKFKFKEKPENKDKWIETGIWKYSRHPNYFGEILVWWGIFISSIPLIKGFQFLSIIGPLYITFLLLKVSGVPMLEKAYDQKFGKNPKYLKYKKNTSLIIPLPPKRK